MIEGPVRPPNFAFDDVAEYVRARTGLAFSAARRPAFDAAVSAAMRRGRVRDVGAYLSLLSTEPGLLDDLVAGITVGETYFFRDRAQLDFVRDEVMPDVLAKRPGGHRLRIWSAGCATGEEPYTLALVTRALGVSPPPHIVATDISRRALAHAVLARYSKWSLRGVPADVVHHCFVPDGSSFHLDPSVRAAVEFGYLNLAEDRYPSISSGIWGMDLIVCRNVLMYFDREIAMRVALRLVDSLADGGWLLPGPSDPAIGDLTSCEVVVGPAGLAYRRVSGHAAQRWRPAAPDVPLTESSRAAELPAITPRRPALELQFDSAPVEPRSPALPDVRVSSQTVADALARYADRDYSRAAQIATALCDSGEGPTAWIVLVRSMANRGDLDAAGRHCAAAIDRHRDCAELLYLHAVLLAQGGRHAEAAAAARGALYLDRGLIVAHMTLGAALNRLNDIDAARRAFSNAERLLLAHASDDRVPASDDATAGRLTQMVRMQLDLIAGLAA